MGVNLDRLIEKTLDGNRRAVSRMITLAENDATMRLEISGRIYPHTGKAYLIGITGPPGSGKSTLTDKIAKHLRSGDHTVGIIAVDPSSPFSGGAILGDRIRMNDLTLDEGIYMRSMASRGHLGGLSNSVRCAARIMDACGCAYILIETVGVGQSEVEIMEIADTTLVVSVPGLGDDIQMIKAGILEIGDILVVNKSDREGAVELANQLRSMQQLAERNRDGKFWTPPVVLTSAQENTGIAELLAEVEKHRTACATSAGYDEVRLDRLRDEVRSLLMDDLARIFFDKLGISELLDRELANFHSRAANPFDWVKNLSCWLDGTLVAERKQKHMGGKLNRLPQGRRRHSTELGREGRRE